MCMQRTWIMNDEDWVYELFIEKATEHEISRFANPKCAWCKGRGLHDNILDERSGYYELCVCDCILNNKEEDIKRYLGVINKKKGNNNEE